MKNRKNKGSYFFNWFFTVLIGSVYCQFVEAQEFTYQITWKQPIKKMDGGVTFDIPTTQNEEFEGPLPSFSTREKINTKHASVTVQNIVTVMPESWEINYLNHIQNFSIQTPTIVASVSIDRSNAFLVSRAFPFYFENGQWKKITSYQLKVTPINAATMQQKSYAATSVLASGDWYKIAVSKNGVYKLDKVFFENLGVDVSTLAPSAVNVYGNADGILSEFNSQPYTDDLKKNAIYFQGNADATFDDNEYFLFYGAGPNEWNYTSGQGFNRTMHIYSDLNHYFIHIDLSDAPLRMVQLSDAGTFNQTVTEYSYYDIHENENVSLVKGGQRWYGELFSGTLSQNFSFTVPDISLTTPVQVQYAVANNGNTAGNNFTVNYNGSQVGFQSLSAIGADYVRNVSSFSFSPVNGNISLNFVFNRVNASTKAYLDFIKMECRRKLSFTGDYFEFRDLNSVGSGIVSQFTITGMLPNYLVWDITSKRESAIVQGVLTGTTFSFNQATDTLREFIAFNPVAAMSPKIVGKIANQNLHALGQYEYVIVSPTSFMGQANRLANLHMAQGTTTIVVDVNEIYNEYSSGNQDATAIRRFLKMFYDRANGNVADQPKYLLLFGDATYDPKNRLSGNNYMIPTYEFLNSEGHIEALVTDDYFGMMNNNESISATDQMDVAVGRMLISNMDHAISQVNKVEHYMKNGINSPLVSNDANSCCLDQANNMFGDWRLIYTIVTDDADDGLNFVGNDAEPASAGVQGNYNEMNAVKLYSDAFTQTITTGGQRYPEVYDAISARVNRGTQIINYIGHGGEVGAAEERIITIPQINAFTNLNRMGLFVTATCEFTKYDDPSRESIGELISLHPTGGSISLMTTTRSIYVSANSQILSSLYSHVFERESNGDPLTYGEIMRRTKNTSGSNDNRRCFVLIGDPALRISIPHWRIVTDSINHKIPSAIDTVRALTTMHVVGHLEDFNGNVITNFNGELTPTIFDKQQQQQTLQNDPMAPLVKFKTQKNALYKGRATVQNGRFSFEFIVPKDIDFNYGRGKISYYADDKQIDAAGWDSSFVVGGINPNPIADNVGPELTVYLNDDLFVNGSLSSPNPLLVIEASDQYGINTVGNGIGHDITAILDGNSGSPIVLNEYYRANLDTYKSGKIQYPLKGLSVGKHTLEIKVWDVNNNSSVVRLEFEVVENAEITIDHVLNYPNPFTTNTKFMFEHNQSCSSLDTQIQIYTVSGRLVRTINETVPTNGFRVEGIAWDGKDDFGDQLAKGVYVYRLSVTTPDGKKAQKLEKLVLLK
jgi:hypothetical protein